MLYKKIMTLFSQQNRLIRNRNFINEKGLKATLINYDKVVNQYCELINNIVRKESGNKDDNLFTQYYYTDSSVIDRFLNPIKKQHINVVEVAAGYNFTVPYTLYKNSYRFHYVMVDVCLRFQKLSIQGITDTGIDDSYILPVLATSSNLPLPDNFAHVFFFLHAIDDIWYSEGNEGILASLKECLRVLKSGGFIISSDTKSDFYPATNYISHTDIKIILDKYGEYKIEEYYENGESNKNWLLIYKNI
ncbi:MAG: class I SAM-dependent methyltransferase [Desulfobacterales bacterium]|nr:class I SAM-dependent methyltransferase [Desulfobacterales bacterium]